MDKIDELEQAAALAYSAVYPNTKRDGRPTFWSEKNVHLRRMPDYTVKETPFDEFEMRYRTNNGIMGYIDNTVFITGRDVVAVPYIRALPHTFIGEIARFNLDDDPATLSCSGRDFFPEVVGLIEAINRVERGVEHPRLVGTIGKRRERIERELNLPRMIRLNRPTPLAERATEVASLSGALRSAHDRRGHYRTYKSGRVIWVRSSHIHGGAKKGQQYII